MDDQTTKQLVEAIVGLLGIGLTSLIPYLIKLLKSKSGIEKNVLLSLAFQQGVAYAEEYAANYLKQNGTKLDSYMKQKLAIDHATDIAPAIASMPQTEVEKRLTAELPKVNLGAAANPTQPVK